jgi:hypothetical protein
MHERIDRRRCANVNMGMVTFDKGSESYRCWMGINPY